MNKSKTWLIKNWINVEIKDVTLANKGNKQNQALQVMITTSKICKYYNKGYCKYKSTCTNVHSKQICSQINCENKKCEYRHPSDCRYKDKCRRIEECLYQHNKFKLIEAKLANKDDKINKLIEANTEIKNEIKKVTEVNKSNDKKINQLKEENQKKIEDHKVIISSYMLKIDELEEKIKTKITEEKEDAEKYNKLVDKYDELIVKQTESKEKIKKIDRWDR